MMDSGYQRSLPSAHFEHTIAVGVDQAEILTKPNTGSA